RVVALFGLVLSLAACDMLGTLTDGWKYAKAVESDLERSIGMKPEVGFNWHNGRLETVTVTFPRIYEAKPCAKLPRGCAFRSTLNSSKRLTISCWLSRWGNRVRVRRHDWTSGELPLAVAIAARETVRGSALQFGKNLRLRRAPLYLCNSLFT